MTRALDLSRIRGALLVFERLLGGAVRAKTSQQGTMTERIEIHIRGTFLLS
jgi:hypothetical protein